MRTRQTCRHARTRARRPATAWPEHVEFRRPERRHTRLVYAGPPRVPTPAHPLWAPPEAGSHTRVALHARPMTHDAPRSEVQ
ncbi:hypothetical protein CHLRE_08g363283v5 [Chlamydomonas reinhardtii]|uniref:Uncharacterized protein n=1 Tax=Chlamydomonas reinhardtii TaxID=3055 RepID=A0A2K3DGM7_CHLRE|nr:uncharacterized protein CHLRE_08g363283v5 [Chlamydomonas reinhardtii]PNW79694.1 hypothetical protein CHLRE_08g363283v5 [Chlamydomonas reinhardtii]